MKITINFVQEKKDKQFSSSYSYLFCMTFPWIVLTIVVILDFIGIIDVLKIKEWIVFAITLIPVFVIYVLYFIINRNSKQPSKSVNGTSITNTVTFDTEDH